LTKKLELGRLFKPPSSDSAAEADVAILKTRMRGDASGKFENARELKSPDRWATRVRPADGGGKENAEVGP
jgi:hypothetical protein